jgi:hypothetical protein
MNKLLENFQIRIVDSINEAFISMQWTEDCEVENSKDLRLNMVSNIRSDCKLKVTQSVLKAMEVVPRHLFMESTITSGDSTSEKVVSAYTHDKPMSATPWSVESSPKIISIQVYF